MEIRKNDRPKNSLLIVSEKIITLFILRKKYIYNSQIKL
jgi:hypothetical protein